MIDQRVNLAPRYNSHVNSARIGASYVPIMQDNWIFIQIWIISTPVWTMIERSSEKWSASRVERALSVLFAAARLRLFTFCAAAQKNKYTYTHLSQNSRRSRQYANADPGASSVLDAPQWPSCGGSFQIKSHPNKTSLYACVILPSRWKARAAWVD